MWSHLFYIEAIYFDMNTTIIAILSTIFMYCVWFTMETTHNAQLNMHPIEQQWTVYEYTHKHCNLFPLVYSVMWTHTPSWVGSRLLIFGPSLLFQPSTTLTVSSPRIRHPRTSVFLYTNRPPIHDNVYNSSHLLIYHQLVVRESQTYPSLYVSLHVHI